MIAGIIQAMILSRALDRQGYGTYSQGLLIISLATTFVGLGLASAINYFYNKTEDVNEKQAYINTIFGITTILGIIGGFVIILSKNGIVDYFNNSALAGLIVYVAFRPLFANVIALYQPLYISNHMTKQIAIRNFLISLFQVIIIGSVSIFSQNIALIFLLLCFLDIVQILIFSLFFTKMHFQINPLKININDIKPIFDYTIPLAIALMMGTILTNMDQLVIAKLMSTEALALYSNVSRSLPFSFISGALTMVATPVIIKLLNSGKIAELEKVWSNYLEIGYRTTWTFCIGAIVCAPELLRFLYSDKYYDGLYIFIVYLCVEVFRFTYFGLILTAKGKTKIILLYSFLTLLLNLILNFVLYYLLGIIGPAFATLISIAVIGTVQLIHSSRLVELSLLNVLRIKQMHIFILQLIIIGLICFGFKLSFRHIVGNNFVILFVTYLLFVLITFGVTIKRIKYLVSQLNISN